MHDNIKEINNLIDNQEVAAYDACHSLYEEISKKRAPFYNKIQELKSQRNGLVIKLLEDVSGLPFERLFFIAPNCSKSPTDACYSDKEDNRIPYVCVFCGESVPEDDEDY